MYSMLLNLWVTNRLPEAGLENAVTKGWITAEQRDMIIATPRNPAA